MLAERRQPGRAMRDERVPAEHELDQALASLVDGGLDEEQVSVVLDPRDDRDLGISASREGPEDPVAFEREAQTFVAVEVEEAAPGVLVADDLCGALPHLVRRGAHQLEAREGSRDASERVIEARRHAAGS